MSTKPDMASPRVSDSVSRDLLADAYVTKALSVDEKLVTSAKARVIELLFEELWPDGQDRPSEPMIVSSKMLKIAIKQRNEEVKKSAPSTGDHPKAGGTGKRFLTKALSDGNTANFLKDFIRKPTCNDNWPKRLRSLRITARQRYGHGQVFEFVDYREPTDTLPFPDRFLPTNGISQINVESLSIPRQARALGRVDEAWLIQAVVSQRIAQLHLSSVSSLDVQELTHLQMSVKTQPEIDAVYIATIKQGSKEIATLVTCEAKQFKERLLEDQIREQVQQAFMATSHLKGNDEVHAVLPIAVQIRPHPTKASERAIYFMEFNLFSREDFSAKYAEKLHEMPLKLLSSAYYILNPSVPGISFQTAAKKKKQGK